MLVFESGAEYDVTITRTIPVGNLSIDATAVFDIQKTDSTYDVTVNTPIIDI